jgi:ABC-type oligopeptide transport system substrate-binding subunit
MSSANGNVSQFCDRAIDAAADAATAAQGADANARWAALDHRLLAAAPAVPLFSQRSVMLLSDRVGNAQMHPELGPLLDQFWVR